MTDSVIKRNLLILFIALLVSVGASADLPNPSTLTIKEITPSEFTVAFTLPVVGGRMASLTPILPDICEVDPEPTLSGDAGKAIRVWTMTCDPNLLSGQPVGIDGLLGTTTNVLLTIETLDKRKYTAQLRPTSAYFVIPPHPTFFQLFRVAGATGLRRLAGYPALVFLIFFMMFSGISRRALLISLIGFSVAHGVGHWFGIQKYLSISLFLPHMVSAGIAWLIGLQILGKSRLNTRWWQPAYILMILLGLLFGAAQSSGIDVPGMSASEHSLSLILFSVGVFAGLVLIALTIAQLRRTLAGLSEFNQSKWETRLVYLSMIITGGIFLYWGSSPLFGGVFKPVVSIINLVTAIALGIWIKEKHSHEISFMSTVIACFFITGIAVGLFLTPPLSNIAVFILPALVGVQLLSDRLLKRWLAILLAGFTCFYQGSHIRTLMGTDISQAVEYFLGAGMIIATVFYLTVKTVPVEKDSKRNIPRIAGYAMITVAAIFQLLEIIRWINGSVRLDLAMGMFPIPVPALVITLGILISWPRRRRFDQRSRNPGIRIRSILLGCVLFIVPVGTVRVDIPFHTPDAPSAAEAGRVLSSLLSDTYSAFNLVDEDTAFDRLAVNISRDLVPDIYLDSRRRLTSGTRQGAKVTVREVEIVEIDEAVSISQSSYTYPCTWVVIARVRHLQHVHDRQNLYKGELTISIEEGRWKISKLDLHDEEQEILSRWRL